MSNPSVAVTQSKTLSVVFKDASNNVIAAGGTCVWTITPANAVVQGTAALQSELVTGQTAGTNVSVTVREPVSGFVSPAFLMDVTAIQMLISQAVITLS